jgi:hypothetical protein
MDFGPLALIRRRRYDGKRLMNLSLAAVAGITLLDCGKSAADLPPKTNDFGTGLNSVDRTYARPAVDVTKAVTAGLRCYDLSLESDKHDDLGGEIVARRADGHKVTAKITSVDKDHTEASIRVAPGNKNLAELIHDRIASKVGTPPAK